jgi:transcriptional regulator with XRE-family HTH domain
VIYSYINITKRDKLGGDSLENSTGADIKMYLQSHGISQAFVSRETGIPKIQLNQSLNGSRRITLDEYSAICLAIGVDTNKFLKPKPLEKAE